MSAKRRFVGKTVASVDTRACNVWTFHFSDGTSTAIEVEAVAPGVYGLVMCDECAMPPPVPPEEGAGR